MNRIKNIKEYIPLIYIVLICLGYLNKSLFFSQFDIDIINYLSIQELVFVFIPLGSLIIGVFLIFLLIIIPIAIFTKEPKVEINQEQSEIQINNWRRRKIYKPLVYISNSFLFILPFALIINYYLFITSKDLYVIPITGMILIAFWILIFSYKYKLKNYKNIIELNERFLVVLLLIQLVACFVFYENHDIMKARKILSGTPAYNVTLKKGKNQIETSNNILYFGETSNFIFFRNLKKEKNIIYKKSDFEEISMQKIKY